MLPRRARLRRTEDIRAVLRRGRRFRSGPVDIFLSALDRGPFRAWYEAAGVPGRRVALEGELGVSMVVGRELPHEVRFDGLGLGQVASTTVRFRRGDAEAGLTLSSYGRVRRW